MSEPLPYLVRSDQPLATAEAFAVRGAAIAEFDALLHEINPDAARVDPDRLKHLMQWLLALSPETAHDVLDCRLGRIEQLRAMPKDLAWDTGDACRQRLVKLLDYVDREDDLIADHEPMIGLLDDVLLLELAWPSFAAEAEDYRDFCNYRDDLHPVGSGEEQRAAWIRDRLAEIALWRHRVEVRGGHYPQTGRSESLFRVR